MKSPREILFDCDILVENGVIVKIDRGISINKDVIHVDCSGLAALPGLVDGHCHSQTANLVGLLEEKDLEEAFTASWDYMRNLSRSEALAESSTSFKWALSCGTTWIIDVTPNFMEAFDAAVDLNIGIMTGPTVQEFDDPHKCLVHLKFLLTRARERKARYHPIIASLIFEDGFSGEQLEVLKEALSKGYSTLFHLPLTRKQVFSFKRKTGHFPIEFLCKEGLLSSKTILVHPGWMTSWEIEAVRNYGATIIDTPSSYMRHASAASTPLQRLLKLDIPVGLGTDGPGISSNMSIIFEASTCYLHYRHLYWMLRPSILDVLKISCLSGCGILGRRKGIIGEGEPAELILLNVRQKPSTSKGVIALLMNPSNIELKYVLIGENLLEVPSFKHVLEKE